MRRFVFSASLIAAMVTSLPASAQSGLYLGFFGGAVAFFDQEIEEGASELEIEYDLPGYVFGGQIGYALATNIRIEGEIAYAFSDGDVSLDVLGTEILDANYDLSVLSGTAGIFLDLWPLGPFVPYVGGGLGFARVTNEVNDVEDDQDVFTAFGDIGLPLSLSPELSIVPSARFAWAATDEDVDEIFADNLFSTQARVGLRYSF